MAGLEALGVRARSGTGQARRYCPLGKVCRGREKGGGSGGAGSGGVRTTGRGCAVPAGDGGPGARSCCELQPSTALRPAAAPWASQSPFPVRGLQEPRDPARGRQLRLPPPGRMKARRGRFSLLRSPVWAGAAGRDPLPTARRSRVWGEAPPARARPGAAEPLSGLGRTLGARRHLGGGPGPAPRPCGLFRGQKVCVE